MVNINSPKNLEHRFIGYSNNSPGDANKFCGTSGTNNRENTRGTDKRIPPLPLGNGGLSTFHCRT